MSDYVIRAATEQDVSAINRIHNQGIIDRVATLDLEPYTDEEKMGWFRAHGLREPVLVATNTEGDIIGYSSLQLFSPRKCYYHVSTLSLYVDRAWRGKGVGKLLLGAILDLGRSHGYSKVILNAFAFNTAGITLYQKFGFRLVGTYERQGQLDGKCVDTVIMEKLL